MAKITEQELKDIEDTLPTKPYVFSYRDDDYVFKTMNKENMKAVRKLTHQQGQTKDENKLDALMDKMISIVMQHCIWPEKEQFDVICEEDGWTEINLYVAYNNEVLNKKNSVGAYMSIKERLKEMDDEVLLMCADQELSMICLERLVSVFKGEEEESEDSYKGMLLLTNTICKINWLVTGITMMLMKKEEKPSDQESDTSIEYIEKKLGKELDKEKLDDMWKTFMEKEKDIFKPPTEKRTRYSK